MPVSTLMQRAALPVLLALSLPACEQPAEAVPPTEETTMPEQPAPPARNRRLTAGQQLEMAQADLAARLDIDVSEITVSGSGPVTWRTSALGCPEPGKMYNEALMPGYLVTLQVGKTTYRYHARASGEPFLCPDDRAESPTQNNVFE